VNDQVEIYEKAWTEQHTHVATSKVERWQKPPLGTIKLNWDTSVDVGANKMGMGMALVNARILCDAGIHH
jgi:hypothetical protein